MPIPSIGLIPLVVDRETIKETLAHAKDTVNLSDNKEERKIERRYDELVPIREPFLEEARRLSRAVMPYLYPEIGSEVDIFSVGSANQSLIAKGVMNLAKKLGSTIFPSNARFFAHTIMPEIAQQVAQAQQQAQQMQGTNPTTDEAAAVQSDVDNRLVARDETIRKTIKATPDAENFNLAMIHAIVAGNACFFKPNVDTSKIYTLEDMVCEYDSSGELVEIIVRDIVHPSRFTPEQLKDLFGSSDLELYEETNQDGIVVYTRQVRRYDHWEIQVEIGGKRYAPMEGKEDLDAPPFIAFPFFLLPKKRYAISWLTHNKGDIIQFENLSLSMNELSKAASKIVAMIPPEMKVTQAELASTAGISYVFGSPSPIQMVLADISKNLQAVTNVYEMVRNALMQAFLLNESIRRDAERVTEYELQQMMQGLQDLLGGLYISIARRFQYPYTRRTERLMVKEGRIPELPTGTYQLTLTAGLETLEAAEELQAQDQLVARMAQFGPEALSQMSLEELTTRTANYLGVVKDKLILTQDQVLDKQGVRQIVELSRQLGPQGPMMFAQGAQMMLQHMQQGIKSPGEGVPAPPSAPAETPPQAQV